MTDKTNNLSASSSQSQSNGSGDESVDIGFSTVEDQPLKELLQSWQVPEAPDALKRRVLDSYREVATEKAFANVFPEYRSEVVEMKHCPTCQEDFAEKFSFCPVDGTPLVSAQIGANGESTVGANETTFSAEDAAPAGGGDQAGRSVGVFPVAAAAAGGSSTAFVPRGEYHLTILQDEGLMQRLARELTEVGRASQLTWPEFRRDPVGFIKRGIVAYSLLLWRFFTTPNVAVGTLAALVIVTTAVLAILALDRRKTSDLVAALQERAELINIREIPEEQKEPEKPKKEGDAGADKGKGGGSKPKPERAAGGGGGGRQEPKPPSFGKLPPASLEIPQVRAPDPKPPVIKNPSLPVPATIVADPVLFPPDTRQIAYGDPKSRSTDPSSGPGRGNGIGTGTGGGVGSGEGGGVGPGRGGNTGGGDRNDGGGGPGGSGVDYNKTFSVKDVTRRAQILEKPEATFTEEARKNNTTGIVRLRLALNANGTVSNISAIKGLPDGLTERAIAAARRIKFVPAQKDGRPVSQWLQVEYNFNIY